MFQRVRHRSAEEVAGPGPRVPGVGVRSFSIAGLTTGVWLAGASCIASLVSSAGLCALAAAERHYSSAAARLEA